MKNVTIMILALVVLISCQKEKQEVQSLQDMLLGRWNVISNTGVSPSDLTTYDLFFGHDKIIFDFDLSKSGSGKCLLIYQLSPSSQQDYYVRFYDFSLNEEMKKLTLFQSQNSNADVYDIEINGDELILRIPKENGGDFTNIIYIAERE
jgi:hypothetical protein